MGFAEVTAEITSGLLAPQANKRRSHSRSGAPEAKCSSSLQITRPHPPAHGARFRHLLCHLASSRPSPAYLTRLHPRHSHTHISIYSSPQGTTAHPQNLITIPEQEVTTSFKNRMGGWSLGERMRGEANLYSLNRPWHWDIGEAWWRGQADSLSLRMESSIK
jgi:hypothetical protein